MPITAIARVRTASRVRSAVSARTAAEIAPAPCTVRPTMVHPIVGAHAAMKLPSAKMTSPATITGFLPQRSEAQPNGTCSTACVSPYAPSASPTSVWSRPPGSPSAYSASTGSTMNMPSMRSPKIPARPTVARRSLGVIASTGERAEVAATGGSRSCGMGRSREAEGR